VSGQQEEGSPVAGLIEALDVERHAKVGVVAGVALAVLGVVLIESSPNRAGIGLKDLVLVFVVVVSTALLVTVLLTVRSVLRLTMSPPKWIRRGGSLATGGGGLLVVLGVLGAVLGSGPLLPVYVRLLPLLALALLGGVWAVHAANRHRYGYPGLAGAVAAGAGVALLSWFATIETGAYLGGPLEQVQPIAPGGITVSAYDVFLGVNFGAALGTTLLGLALLRDGTVPQWPALGLSFVLPVELAAVTAVVELQSFGLLSVALLVPPGVAWFATGRAFRSGRGVPPAEAFETDLPAGQD
jgi:hypothetical protein